MKTTRTALACLFAVALTLTCIAADTDKEKAKKPEQITLEDVIFDVTYLKKLLGPKTLVTAVEETNRGRKKTENALADAIMAAKEANLDEKSQIFALPDDATQPTLKSSIPHTYPPGLKISREPKKADFLMLIGADGVVKCLYCYRHNDRLFALAAALAVVKWRYEPAKIGDVAVPVVAGLPMWAETGDINIEGFKGLPRRNSEGGVPVPKEVYKPSGPGG